MPQPYRRKQYDELRERLLEPRQFIQVLAGPRQVGKTTLVAQVCEALPVTVVSESADSIEPTDTDWIRRTWIAARSRMMVERLTELVLVIDEVQKLRNWSEAVKREWDADTLHGLNLKVVLLGSSRLLLKAGLTESLAGRFELIRMSHWRYDEMRDAFGYSLDDYIYYGGYPGTAGLRTNFPRWRRYVRDALIAPAIEKDVILTSNIYKPALMKQLFELGCSYSAELLSLTKLLGQLQDAGNVTTLADYLRILGECQLLTSLQKYAGDQARRYSSIPKYQVYNNALMTAYVGSGYEADRIDPARWGRWVESAVGAHLLAQEDEADCKVYYWREGADEVDFIIVRQGRTIALEVKSGRRSTNRGLTVFEKKFHPLHSLVVGSGGIPLEDFLSTPIDRLFY